MSKARATFQPTVRPDWLGAMDYIPTEEQVKIFQAILAFPSIDLPESSFWTKTIKPDLQQQLENFLRFCNQRKIAARNRWNNNISKNKDLDASGCTCIPSVCTVKDKEKDNNIYNNLYNNLYNNNTGVINKGGLGEERRGDENDPQINPPTLEQVLSEAEMQNSIAGCGGYKISQENAEMFYTTYAPSNWRIHNEHETPIRDWKAMLRGWAIKKRKERLAELEKDGIPIAPKPFRDDSKNAKK